MGICFSGENVLTMCHQTANKTTFIQVCDCTKKYVYEISEKKNTITYEIQN